ncbi:hypothetical protein [Streptomyces sp. NPDC048710]|uniref:hypothetical protein n=1 Tax=Streptomyces sp. NPDC048710 TaxID=3365586 RepID=UPI003719240F
MAEAHPFVASLPEGCDTRIGERGAALTRRPQDGTEGHIGFGHGIHYCVGVALSRLQCEIALTTLLAQHPGLCLADGPESLRRTAIPGAAPRLPHLRVRG